MYSDMYRKHCTKQNNQSLQRLSWFKRSLPMQKVGCSNPGGDKPKLIKLINVRVVFLDFAPTSNQKEEPAVTVSYLKSISYYDIWLS